MIRAGTRKQAEVPFLLYIGARKPAGSLADDVESRRHPVYEDGAVRPSPKSGLVAEPDGGALLVKEGRVLGVGYHRYDKLRHAESYAAEMAGSDSQGSTLYCSLEPCCHHGRTPPCTDALIAAGITRAVIAMKDPNPLVDGRGIEPAAHAGTAGIGDRECRRHPTVRRRDAPHRGLPGDPGQRLRRGDRVLRDLHGFAAMRRGTFAFAFRGK